MKRAATRVRRGWEPRHPSGCEPEERRAGARGREEGREAGKGEKKEERKKGREGRKPAAEGAREEPRLPSALPPPSRATVKKKHTDAGIGHRPFAPLGPRRLGTYRAAPRYLRRFSPPAPASLWPSPRGPRPTPGRAGRRRPDRPGPARVSGAAARGCSFCYPSGAGGGAGPGLGAPPSPLSGGAVFSCSNYLNGTGRNSENFATSIPPGGKGAQGKYVLG